MLLECHIFLNLTMFAQCLAQMTKPIFLKIIAVHHQVCGEGDAEAMEQHCYTHAHIYNNWIESGCF